jgi:dTDP-4-amino-4,6-dideoxygalactose transaminase
MSGLSIPLVDLRAQYLTIRDEVLAAIGDVLEGMQLTLGPQLSAFEAEFAAYCGARHCVGVGNGTDALVLALRAAGVGPGDEVIVPAHTFIATAEAVSLIGARPAFVDIEPETRCIDPRQIERAITARTRAVIAVHIHGQMADLDAIEPIARGRGLTLIEDAAQAHGAELRGRRAGSMGDFGCFSFYCSKNLGAYGEAGAVTTNDDAGAERLRLLRHHGDSGRYAHVCLGTNSRMDEIQAAILRVKLRRLDAWNDARRARALRLSRLLAGLELELPREGAGRRHMYHHYALLIERREAVREALAQAGIATGVHYPDPLHLQPPYRDLGYRRGDLPVAESVTSRTLSLPMYAELTEAQIERIAAALARVAGRAAPAGAET